MTDEIRRLFLQELKKQGLTQEQAAERLGVTDVQMSRIMNGHSNKLPSFWRDALALVNLKIFVAPIFTDELASNSEKKDENVK